MQEQHSTIHSVSALHKWPPPTHTPTSNPTPPPPSHLTQPQKCSLCDTNEKITRVNLIQHLDLVVEQVSLMETKFHFSKRKCGNESKNSFSTITVYCVPQWYLTKYKCVLVYKNIAFFHDIGQYYKRPMYFSQYQQTCNESLSGV